MFPPVRHWPQRSYQLSRAALRIGPPPPASCCENAWQSINIGDIAHYLGMLELLGQYIPEAEVRLWPGTSRTVRGTAPEDIPKCVVLKGKEAVAALSGGDFFLHAPAPLRRLQGRPAVDRGNRKPFGVFGISLTST